ncbi:MAG: hypothetical protein U9P72_06395 [Campylobacterota bacterium]|nr:hypothetical protein [Campylobacterota bacterium]
MTKHLFLVLLLSSTLLIADFDYGITNTNITSSQDSLISDESYIYNYDRLRFRTDYTEGEFFATAIFDIVNYGGSEFIQSQFFHYLQKLDSDTPFNTHSNFYHYEKGAVQTKLYRFYGGYEDDKNRVILGLQNISMGVGRIFNPTNLFNPKNSYAIEPDEVFGVAGISYTKHIDEMSDLMLVISQKADKSFKYAGQYKTFLEFGDFGIDFISSDITKMLGLELEANLADSGVEVRSEVAYIESTLKTITDTEEKKFYQVVVGADYGFINGVSMLGEILYSSESFTYDELLLNLDSEIVSNLVYSKFHTALSLSYGFNIFLDGSLVYIESFNDKNSRFISPTLNYTLNDYNSFTLGAMFHNGDEESEFGSLENRYFFKWSLSF